MRARAPSSTYGRRCAGGCAAAVVSQLIGTSSAAAAAACGNANTGRRGSVGRRTTETHSDGWCARVWSVRLARSPAAGP